MTVQSIVWVLEESSAEARTRCVAFALANRFDADQPLSCWPGMERVAKEGKMAVRTAQRCVDELVVELGELIVILNAGGPPNVREDRRPNVYIFPALLGRERLRELLAEYPREDIVIGAKWGDCAPPAKLTGCQIDTPFDDDGLEANSRADADAPTATGCQAVTPSTTRGVTEIDARGVRNSTRGVTEIDARGDTADTRSHIEPSLDPTVTLASGEIAERPKRRRRDEIWDAVIDVCGLTGVAPTSTERGAWNRAVKDLREVGATVSEIHRRGRAFRDRWPAATLTPTALARRWNEVIANPGSTRTPAAVVADTDAQPAYWVEDYDTRAHRAVETLAAEVRVAFGDQVLLEGAHACLEQNAMVQPDDLALAAELYAEAHSPAEQS